MLNVTAVDGVGGRVPRSHSCDVNNAHTRPDVLPLDSSIPEETSVEIADTSYAPVASPDEPPAHGVAAAGVDHEHNTASVAGDIDAAVKHEMLQVDNDQLPNGKGVQSASSSASNKLKDASRLRSVLVAVAAVLMCTLIGAIVMFEFDGNVPFSSSLHALPGLIHFRRKIYHPLHCAIGCSVSS